MRRREALLAAAALAVAPSLRAQAPRMRRIGVLMPGTRESYKGMLEGFAKRLAAIGWEEGRNAAIEVSYADNRLERLTSLAREIVAGKPDLIVTNSTPAALAMREATTSVPVIFTSVADPVTLGLVQSLGRPGGNMTGVSNQVLDLAGKQFELLTTLVPRMERLALMVSPGNKTDSLTIARLETATRNARATLIVIEVGNAQALDAAFAKAVAERATAMIIPMNPLYRSLGKRIAQLATGNRIATAFPAGAFVRDGGLVSYGPNYRSEFLRSAEFVDRILRGAKPADLPVEQVERFEMVINRGTAKALGLAIPQSVLVRADEVVE